jgi:hypothetical protein
MEINFRFTFSFSYTLFNKVTSSIFGISAEMSKDEEMKFVLELEEPSQELLDWAKDNIGENSDTKSQMISELRDMIYCK